MPVLRYFVRFFSNGFRVPSLTLRSLTHFAEAGAHGQSEKEGSNFVLCQHREFNMLSFFLICAPNTFVRSSVAVAVRVYFWALSSIPQLLCVST